MTPVNAMKVTADARETAAARYQLADELLLHWSLVVGAARRVLANAGNHDTYRSTGTYPDTVNSQIHRNNAVILDEVLHVNLDLLLVSG